MSDLLESIGEQLRRRAPDEAVALVCDFLASLDEYQQQRFLNLVVDGPRALVAETLGLDDPEDLLARIEELHEALANDEYVTAGVGYDPEYRAHRGFGDDSWIDELDELFAAATSLFRAGQFAAAVKAYTALFGIFDLVGDDFHFTRPDPVAALRTDIDAMEENLFVAIGNSDPDPAETAIAASGDTLYLGDNRYTLLDAWQDHPAWMAALEAALIDQARAPAAQDHHPFSLSHPAHLLRELYRRYRTPADLEALCREIGPQQGWPYEDVVQHYRAQGQWQQVLAWAEEGLARLPETSRYRLPLQEAYGQALRHLDRPDEAFQAFWVLFEHQRTVDVYLQLRDAARASDRWGAAYPRLVRALREYVLAETGETSYAGATVIAAGLLGFAYLLEGDWQAAAAWAVDPEIPMGWDDHDVLHIVATGLALLGMVAAGQQSDEVLVREIGGAPEIIREHRELLEAEAQALPADSLLDSAVRLYERLVERAIDGRNRATYAEGARHAAVIQALRRAQGRAADFDRYYQELLTTYSRYSALKDELRTAIEGPGYKRKR